MLAQPADWKKSVTDEMMQYSMACNADFILCDSTGAVLVNSSKDPVCSPHNISVHELEAFSDNCEYVYSDLGGAFDAIYHVIGKSFKANGPEYYVLAFSSKAAQDDYTYNIMEIFIVSAIIVLVIVMFLVYFMTLKLTEPIKEIAEVSKKIGAGDFSVTLPDYSTSELEQLSNAFNDMAASLKSYDTMRNSFLANVSHELRTPMTSIGGFVDGLLDGTIPKEQERYYLKIISSEVHRLARLVRSMLNLAKIEAGELKPNLQYFSVLEPIVDTLVTFEPRLEEKQIEIRGLDVDRVTLYADNDLVHQVMYNLIENAIKVSGGKVGCDTLTRIIDMGKSLLNMPATPLPGVAQTLKALRGGKQKMVVFTKGDNLDQENKFKRSGLQPFFDDCIVVADKTTREYEHLCQLFDVSLDQLCMVGNSFKSDVRPG